MKNSLNIFLITAAFGTASIHAQNAEPVDCDPIASSVTRGVQADKSEVLNIVSRQVGQAPTCACEIVKAAIASSEADNDLIGQIVETAINAAPNQANLIAQCATAEAPDAIVQINNAVANAGATPGLGGLNPLDFPGDVAGGGVVNGGDQNSGGGAGDGSQGGGTGGNLPVNQDPEPPVVTDPSPGTSTTED